MQSIKALRHGPESPSFNKRENRSYEPWLYSQPGIQTVAWYPCYDNSLIIDRKIQHEASSMKKQITNLQ